ncbi:hypothetical protein GCM10027202_17130 [Microvirgula curvata]
MTTEQNVRNVLHMITGHYDHSTSLQAARAARAPSPGRRLQAAAPASPGAMPDWAIGHGVQALGLGEKETCGIVGTDIVLKIYVDKKLPSAKLDKPVPKTVSVGGMTVYTDVVEIGKVHLHGNTQRIRPALPGFSVSRANDGPNTGTFGLVVNKQGQPSPQYLLSNWHAIAAAGQASKGDVIIQPGTADNGSAETDRIGILSDWVPMDFTPNSTQNLVDAAIAQLDPGAASAAIALLGIPTGVNNQLSRGMYVQKVGRTTSLSVARITDVDLVLNPSYPTPTGPKQVTLRDQVLVTFYSAPGDSGSGVLDMNNNVVGLHVGGSDVVGFFCKIQNVLDILGLEVVTQGKTGTPSASQ